MLCSLDQELDMCSLMALASRAGVEKTAYFYTGVYCSQLSLCGIIICQLHSVKVAGCVLD